VGLGDPTSIEMEHGGQSKALSTTVILFALPTLAGVLGVLLTLFLGSFVGAVLFRFCLFFKPIIICEDECHQYAFKHLSFQLYQKYSESLIWITNFVPNYRLILPLLLINY
jgi:hypothetical protein